jgi:hypothetical protein
MAKAAALKRYTCLSRQHLWAHRQNFAEKKAA